MIKHENGIQEQNLRLNRVKVHLDRYSDLTGMASAFNRHIGITRDSGSLGRIPASSPLVFLSALLLSKEILNTISLKKKKTTWIEKHYIILYQN